MATRMPTLWPSRACGRTKGSFAQANVCRHFRTPACCHRPRWAALGAGSRKRSAHCAQSCAEPGLNEHLTACRVAAAMCTAQLAGSAHRSTARPRKRHGTAHHPHPARPVPAARRRSALARKPSRPARPLPARPLPTCPAPRKPSSPHALAPPVQEEPDALQPADPIAEARTAAPATPPTARAGHAEHVPYVARAGKHRPPAHRHHARPAVAGKPVRRRRPGHRRARHHRWQRHRRNPFRRHLHRRHLGRGRRPDPVGPRRHLPDLAVAERRVHQRPGGQRPGRHHHVRLRRRHARRRRKLLADRHLRDHPADQQGPADLRALPRRQRHAALGRVPAHELDQQPDHPVPRPRRGRAVLRHRPAPRRMGAPRQDRAGRRLQPVDREQQRQPGPVLHVHQRLRRDAQHLGPRQLQLRRPHPTHPQREPVRCLVLRRQLAQGRTERLHRRHRQAVPRPDLGTRTRQRRLLQRLQPGLHR